MNTCIVHPSIRTIRQLRRRRPTGLSIRPHGIPSPPQTQRQKHGADLRNNPSQYDLFPSSFLHRLPELGLIPCIDLDVAPNERRVGIHLRDLLEEGPIGPVFGRGGQDSGQVEELAQLGEDVVAEFGGAMVADELEEASWWLTTRRMACRR